MFLDEINKISNLIMFLYNISLDIIGCIIASIGSITISASPLYIYIYWA